MASNFISGSLAYRNNLKFIKHSNSINVISNNKRKKVILKDEQQGLENTDVNPCIYAQLIYDKGLKNIQWRKDSSSVNGAGKTTQPHCKRMKLDHLSYTIYKN